MDRSYLFSLSQYLGQYITLDEEQHDPSCDHTFRYTLEWIAAHQLDRETWLGWLQQRGAWCDCGVVLLFVPHELGENTPTVPADVFRTWHREA